MISDYPQQCASFVKISEIFKCSPLIPLRNHIVQLKLNKEEQKQLNDSATMLKNILNQMDF